MKEIQQALLNWFHKNKRALPWRETYLPYHVWIAEVMMQQTQMDRGVEYFLRWIKQFPDIASVAYAPEEKLLSAWEGLGYYRRVRYLQSAAQVIMHKYNGTFPERYEDILELPGIGPYTAGAIASTAFNQDFPCIDGNVERVISRIFDINTPIKKEPTKSKLYDLVKQLIPKKNARDFNQSIMEVGALVCKKKPMCLICPVYSMCNSRMNGTQFNRPVLAKKTPTTRLKMVTGILKYNQKIFIQQRLENDIWGKLWEFPSGCIETGETPESAIIRNWNEQLGFSIQIENIITTIIHNYTHYHITLYCFDTCFSQDIINTFSVVLPNPTKLSALNYRWVSQEELQTIPLPSPHRKLATLFFNTKNK